MKKGRRKSYSDESILCCLILRAVYHLPLRALQGFLQWIFDALRFAMPVPSYTRICRRAVGIGQELKRLTVNGPTDIVFDSTGVKIYGEGEWKVRQHGKSKRRTWRKIHLAICPHSHEIVLSELTVSTATDANVAIKMVKKLPGRTRTVYGGGAYDQGPFYRQLYLLGIQPITPPRRGGRVCNIAEKPWMESRNDALRAIAGLGKDDEARDCWKNLTGYHTRSLVETAMYRFKRMFGSDFRSRELRRQKAELYAKVVAMNKMTELGMPRGHWFTV